jgi:hypothetical protein
VGGSGWVRTVDVVVSAVNVVDVWMDVDYLCVVLDDGLGWDHH